MDMDTLYNKFIFNVKSFVVFISGADATCAANDNNQETSVTYIRWGSKECGENAKKIYSGMYFIVFSSFVYYRFGLVFLVVSLAVDFQSPFFKKKFFQNFLVDFETKICEEEIWTHIMFKLFF